jgi:hypothetical protein
MSEVASGIVALFPLTVEVGANRLWHVLWEHAQLVKGDVPGIEQPLFSLLFGSSIHL